MVKKRLPSEVLEFFRKQGAKGGKIGGKRSLETMTPEQRVARAKRASAAAVAARLMRSRSREFITVDPQKLEVALASQGKAYAIMISLAEPRLQGLTPLQEEVYYSVLYGTFPSKENAVAAKRGVHTGHMLAPPDPWLVVIAGVMWQGIVQGMAWDALKLFVREALQRMQQLGIAPVPENPAGGRKTTLKFRWTEFATDEKKQYEMFVALERRVRSMPSPRALSLAFAQDGADLKALSHPLKPKRSEARRKHRSTSKKATD
jgi:hypothetical protein